MKKYLIYALIACTLLTTLTGCTQKQTELDTQSKEQKESIAETSGEISETVSEMTEKIEEILSETKENVEETTEKEVSNKNEQEIKLEKQSVFDITINLIDAISASNKNNIVISGLSLNYALAMLANGTSFEATTELEKYFGMTKEEINNYYSSLINSSDNDEVIIANSLWTNIENTFPIKSSYTKLLSQKYKADVEKISMDKKGAKIINKWVEDSTNKLIKEFVSEEDLSGMDAILINAITFEDKWKNPFDAKDTKKDTFTNFDGSTKEIDMMNSKEFFYYENDEAVGFKKEYKNENYYFVGILPKEEGDFNLSDINIEKLLKTEKSTSELNIDLLIELPKIDVENYYDLTDNLKKIGIKNVFDPTKNNLSEIFESEDPEFRSYVDKIAQKTVLKVDEEGTKAAAVTGVFIDGMGAMPKKTISINFNRPFICIIMDKENNIPLFMAKITNFN